MDEKIEGIREMLEETGEEYIAGLLEGATHEVIESGTYGKRLFSTVSTLLIKSSPKKIAQLNKLSDAQKEKIMEAAILFYPIQDNSPEIREVIFQAVPVTANSSPKTKKKISSEEAIGALTSGNTYCVIIAVENYHESSDFPRVDYATKDADDFLESMRIIGHDTAGFVVLKNNKATKSAIIAKIKHFSNIAEKNDRIIIYFAGHGFYEGGKNLLAPVDAVKSDKMETCVPIHTVMGFLSKSKCVQNILFIDCCHSGYSFGDEVREGEDSFLADQLMYDYRDEEFCIGFASCMSNQKSISHPKLKNGVWSYFLNKALRGDAEDIYDSDILFSDKLQSYLKRETSKYVKMNTEKKRDQTPIVFGSQTDKFIIANLAPILDERRIAKKVPEISLVNVFLTGEETESIKNLPGFQRGHFVPDSYSGAANGFVADKGGEQMVKDELDSVSKSVRIALKYKRGDLITSAERGSGSVTTPDFDYHVSVQQSELEPSQYVFTRRLENFKNEEIVNSKEFNQIFNKHFDKLELELSDSIEIEAFIDKIEALPETAGMTVDYNDSDLSECTLKIKGIHLEIKINKRLITFETSYTTSPENLLKIFTEARNVILSQRSIDLIL